MSSEMPKLGELCHIEIPAPNLNKAKEFYSKLFGWDVNDVPGMDGYAFWGNGSNSGGFDKSMKPGTDGVNLVLAVPDINAKLSEIKTAGGTITKDKTEIPGNHGFYASFKDPNGNAMSIWCKT